MVNELRPLTGADLPALLQLDQQLFLEPWSADAFQRALDTERYLALGVFAGARLVGYLVGSAVADEGELLQIGVTPESRRQGIAAVLLAEFRRWLSQRRVAAVFLEVRASARGAIAFYGQAGFTQIGRRKDYYLSSAGREDALLFSLTL